MTTVSYIPEPAAVERRRRRKADYQMGLGAAALKDLARFCYAFITTFDENPHKQAVLEGRRQVWMHIQRYLKLTPEELALLERRVILDPTGEHDG